MRAAGAALADLQARGWIVCTKTRERGYDGNGGRTAPWRLTEFPMSTGRPTEDYKRWTEGRDVPVKVYASHSPRRRKQKPPPKEWCTGEPENGALYGETGCRCTRYWCISDYHGERDLRGTPERSAQHGPSGSIHRNQPERRELSALIRAMLGLAEAVDG